jgi:hypothetical protein
LAVEVVVGGGGDEPGSQFGEVDALELVVVVEVADVVDDPCRLVGEGVSGEGGDPGSSGVVGRVG